jgi:hypothetical protein
MVQFTIDRIHVESYSDGWMVYEKSAAGRRNDPSYYRTIGSALQAVFERRLRRSDAKNLAELRADIAAIHAEITALVSA